MCILPFIKITCLSAGLCLPPFRFCILDLCVYLTSGCVSDFVIIFNPSRYTIHYFPNDSACCNGSMALQAAATDRSFRPSHFTSSATTISTLKVTVSLCYTSSQAFVSVFFSYCQSKSVHVRIKGPKALRSCHPQTIEQSDECVFAGLLLIGGLKEPFTQK